MSGLFDVWFVPLKPVRGWVEHKVNKKPMTHDDAELFAYEARLDEPAPDRDEYMKWEVRPTRTSSLPPGGPLVEFDAASHTYRWQGRRLRSATELVAMLRPEFDRDEAALSGFRVGARPGWKKRTLEKWDAAKEVACENGKVVHAQAEKVLLAPGAGPDTGLAGWIKRHSDKLTVEATEWVLGWPELGVAGTVDAVCHSRASGLRHVFDWKTNKRFRTENKFGERLKPPFDDLQDCELHCYSLQVGVYRLLVKHACPTWRTGPSFVVHVGPDGVVTAHQALDLRTRLAEWIKSLPPAV